jgi:uncharacterized protein YkwD
VVVYPADGQAGVPRLFAPAAELPNPAPHAKGSLVGYPVTVTFAPGTAVKEVAGALRDADGRALELWVSAPDRPANEDYSEHQGDTVCLIAKAPLRPKARYTATVSARVDGRAWSHTWGFTTGDEAREDRQAVARALARINAYRRLAGLKPVTLDAAKSRGARAHAVYLVENNVAKARPVALEEERQDLPCFTEEGRDAARTSFSHDGLGPEDVVEELILDSVALRHLILDPGRKVIGIGAARYPGRCKWVSVFTLFGDQGRWPTSSVVYPADGQKEVPPMHYGPESMVESPFGEFLRGGLRGYPVTAAFPPGAKVAGVTGRLEDGGGKEVEAPVFFGERLGLPEEVPNVVCLLAAKPLKEEKTYTVRLKATVDGKAWERSWSFTTGRGPGPGAQAAAGQMLAALNRYRKAAGLRPVALDPALSRGCLLHARYLIRNAYHFEVVDPMARHDEDPTFAAFSPEGLRAARSSALAPHWFGGPAEAVDAWMHSLYHRISLLHPRLERGGCAFLRTRPSYHDYIAVMDVRSGLPQGDK